MCGIIGCVGHTGATEYTKQGLEALEYRGYDSMGIAFTTDNGGIQTLKTLGGIPDLSRQLDDTTKNSHLAIGHTRWATHGRVSTQNAHPHVDEQTEIAIVHNGTIENFQELKQELQADGFSFLSETDTEVIPHLIRKYLRSGQEPQQAFTSAMRRLTGAYAVLGIFKDMPNTLMAARLASPLVIGVGENEYFAASDPSVITEKTTQVIFMEDNEVFELTPQGHVSWHTQNGDSTQRNPKTIDGTYEKAELGDYPHFMLKEIHDSSDVVRAALSGRVLPHENIVKLGGLENTAIRERLGFTDKIIVVACGTSYHAGLIGERLIEEYADVPVEVHLASEFKYRHEPLSKHSTIIAVSQSGETADTIAALQKGKDHGLLALGINNTAGSTIDRQTDAGIHCRAGKEVSVASTKAFISQVTAFAELALFLSKQQDSRHTGLMQNLVQLPAQLEGVLRNHDVIQQVAKKYATTSNFLYVGRGYEHTSALEGALKLKEISYIHAEGCSAGEMKHGTLALIDENFPTLAIATQNNTFAKTISNIQEIKARGGPVIALAHEGNEEITHLADDILYVPQTIEQVQPILNAVVMQLFAYYMATEKELNVDRPRNLAKSVTVE